MVVVGIVAEYNPFHNGHLAQIEYARKKLKADYIIVAMSPDFTQRGDAALFPKDTRAKMALLNGVDMVIEIPVNAATSSAESYAHAGVKLLASLGLVTHLLFSAEDNDMDKFHTIGHIVAEESLEYKNVLNETLTLGRSYAVARNEAILAQLKSQFSELIDKKASKENQNDDKIANNSLEDYIHFLNQPNNILGIEYIKAIYKNAYHISPVCMKRIGSDYHSKIIKSNFSSATAIRESFKGIFGYKEYKKAVPRKCYEVYKSLHKDCDFVLSDDMSILLHQKLISENNFTKYLDINETISNKINKHKNEFVSISQFADILKSKDLTYTRITRCLCHILLGITNDMTEIPYIYILGFSVNGTQLLRSIKDKSQLPYFTSVKDGLKIEDESVQKILKLDIYGSDLYRTMLTMKTGHPKPTELTKKFEII